MTTATRTPETMTAELLDALYPRTDDPGLALTTTPAGPTLYGYTADRGTVIALCSPAYGYAVAYVPAPGVTAALDWWGTHTDADAEATFHETPAAALADLMARRAAHAVTDPCPVCSYSLTGHAGHGA